MAIKRGILEATSETPSVPSLTQHAADAETVAAPDLSSLEVAMEDPPDIDEDRLLECFRSALFEKLPRQDLAKDSKLEADDVMTINTCALVDGALVPFSAHLGVQLIVEHLPHLPGFIESILEKASVAETIQFALTLPADYSAKPLRGETAVFVVEVLGAQRLAGIHDEDNFQALGFGETLDECMQHLMSVLDEEMADTLLLEAQDKVLRAFSSQVAITIPDDWMTREIQALWKRAEEPALKHFGFDVSERDRSLNAWLSDEKTRAEVEHRLRLEVGLAALQREQDIEVSDRALRELLLRWARRPGFGPPRFAII